MGVHGTLNLVAWPFFFVFAPDLRAAAGGGADGEAAFLWHRAAVAASRLRLPPARKDVRGEAAWRRVSAAARQLEGSGKPCLARPRLAWAGAPEQRRGILETLQPIRPHWGPAPS
mmetsp:Transcript_3339/g.13777  ORF Transcript_3339/g.13777 Transcript_3339/m.13777 type:complete len:115 (-) Transcript_3339:54-398(-)